MYQNSQVITILQNVTNFFVLHVRAVFLFKEKGQGFIDILGLLWGHNGLPSWPSIS